MWLGVSACVREKEREHAIERERVKEREGERDARYEERRCSEEFSGFVWSVKPCPWPSGLLGSFQPNQFDEI